MVFIWWLDAYGCAAAGRKLTLNRGLGRESAPKEEQAGIAPCLLSPDELVIRRCSARARAFLHLAALPAANPEAQPPVLLQSYLRNARSSLPVVPELSLLPRSYGSQRGKECLSRQLALRQGIFPSLRLSAGHSRSASTHLSFQSADAQASP